MERRLFFDIYSILAVFGVVILGALMIYAGLNYQYITPYIGLGGFVGAMSACMLVFLLSLVVVFSKDVLILTDDGIVLGHNILFLRIDLEYMPKDKIAAVDIGHNPTTDRYYLSIISDERSLIFGKNMPLDDLRWALGLVIKELAQ